MAYANGEIYLQQSGHAATLLSAFGRKLIIKPTEISRVGRTASGRMVKDIIAVKYQFSLPYDAIDGDKLQTILTLYDLKETLTLYIYFSPTTYFLNNNGVAPVVHMSPVERERLIMLGTGIWVGTTVTLDEV